MLIGMVIMMFIMIKILENKSLDKGGEIQLTDALLKLIEEETMYDYDFEGRRYGVGKSKTYIFMPLVELSLSVN